MVTVVNIELVASPLQILFILDVILTSNEKDKKYPNVVFGKSFVD